MLVGNIFSDTVALAARPKRNFVDGNPWANFVLCFGAVLQMVLALENDVYAMLLDEMIDR